MGIRTKGKRRIIVRDQVYFWYIALDDDSSYSILNIVSDDKHLILSCPLRTKIAYVISKGIIFQTKATNGIWNRYILPFEIPDMITPKFVENLITWSTQNSEAMSISWNGDDVPV